MYERVGEILLTICSLSISLPVVELTLYMLHVTRYRAQGGYAPLTGMQRFAVVLNGNAPQVTYRMMKISIWYAGIRLASMW